MYKRLRIEFGRRMEENLQANQREWGVIGLALEKQDATSERLMQTIVEILSRCAEIHQRDRAMQDQIDRNRELIYGHLNLLNPGKHGVVLPPFKAE